MHFEEDLELPKFKEELTPVGGFLSIDQGFSQPISGTSLEAPPSAIHFAPNTDPVYRIKRLVKCEHRYRAIAGRRNLWKRPAVSELYTLKCENCQNKRNATLKELEALIESGHTVGMEKST